MRVSVSQFRNQISVRSTYNEDDGTALEEVALEALVDDPTGGMYIESGEHVVEEQDVRLRVHSAREGNASLLAAAQGKALLADLSHVSSVEQRQVALEGALVDNYGQSQWAATREVQEMYLCCTSPRRRALRTECCPASRR